MCSVHVCVHACAQCACGGSKATLGVGSRLLWIWEIELRWSGFTAPLSAELSWQPDGEVCMWLVSWRANVKSLSYFRDVSFNELTSLPTEGLNGLNQLKLVGNFKLKGALAARDFANLRCVCLCPLFLLLVTSLRPPDSWASYFSLPLWFPDCSGRL